MFSAPGYKLEQQLSGIVVLEDKGNCVNMSIQNNKPVQSPHYSTIYSQKTLILDVLGFHKNDKYSLFSKWKHIMLFSQWMFYFACD